MLVDLALIGALAAVLALHAAEALTDERARAKARHSTRSS